MIEFDHLPRTRKEARAATPYSARYFTGKPCSHGHIAPRYTRKGICVECRHAGEKRRRQRVSERLRHAPLPRTAKEARAAGSKHYFTGKPCPHGHIAPRFTSVFTCMECNRISSRTRVLRSRKPALTLSVPAGEMQALIAQLVAQRVTTVNVEVRQ